VSGRRRLRGRCRRRRQKAGAARGGASAAITSPPSPPRCRLLIRPVSPSRRRGETLIARAFRDEWFLPAELRFILQPRFPALRSPADREPYAEYGAGAASYRYPAVCCCLRLREKRPNTLRLSSARHATRDDARRERPALPTRRRPPHIRRPRQRRNILPGIRAAVIAYSEIPQGVVDIIPQSRYITRVPERLPLRTARRYAHSRQ